MYFNVHRLLERGIWVSSRYMSVDPPPKPMVDGQKLENNDWQDDQAQNEDFFVDNPNYEAPVNNYHFHLGHALMKRGIRQFRKRQSDDPTSKWKCQSTLEWEDLGDGYFPRYLRKVKCLCERCWYNHYKCRPRSFTVTLLRRRSDVKCSYGDKPIVLEDEWEIVEKAVPFCCDCVPD
ncbi:hypothetical protein BIW11_09345 [Tropilaelaps mercedesae]|uniref:Protein trunk-like n=1 Tax=Tropilaelaps mercedesae TaxID=418985 RepID=A0A1V9XKK2_9ACAR|nr:hypothetical protein BIW11_09345 [Tropilaelaps mercedesae]